MSLFNYSKSELGLGNGGVARMMGGQINTPANLTCSQDYDYECAAKKGEQSMLRKHGVYRKKETVQEQIERYKELIKQGNCEKRWLENMLGISDLPQEAIDEVMNFYNEKYSIQLWVKQGRPGRSQNAQ